MAKHRKYQHRKRTAKADIKGLTPREAYRLGFNHGSGRLLYRMELLKRTNARLWDELTELDKIEPVDGIIVSLTDARKIIEVLRKPKKSHHFARKLQKLIKKFESESGRRNLQFCEENKDDIA